MLSNNLPTMSININQVTGLPKLALLPDMSYLAPDCFHPSQKLHAKSKHQIFFFCQNRQSMGNQSHPSLYSLVSLAVWNNMFEDDRAKSSWGQGSAGIRCNIVVLIFVLLILIPFRHCTLHCDFSIVLFLQSFLTGVQPLHRHPRTTLEALLPHRPQQPPLIHQLLMGQPGMNFHAF